MKSSRPVAKALCTALAVAAPSLFLSSAALAGSAEQKVRLLVSHQPAQAAALKAELAALGARVTADLADADALAIEVPASKLSRLKALKSVAEVETDAVRTIQGSRATAPARAGTASSSQVMPYGIPMVQADQVVERGSWTPKVCIIDSGIDAFHEDLSKNKMDGANFSGEGQWYTDELGHGSHVAGTIAARFNKLGVVGVNADKQVKLYIAKVFGSVGSASSSTVALAMSACLQMKADVVSMSLGGDTATNVEARMARKLAKSGALVIAAAGNAGTTAISYPAGFPEVMSVAAIDSTKAWANFSQYNADVEIAAPGVSVLSTVPTGTGRDAALSVAGTSYQANPLTGAYVGNIDAPLYNFGLGTAVDTAVAGKVCLISRGSVSFAVKVQNCEASGGVGAVIYNNAPGNFIGTLGGVETHIPSMSLSQADGQYLVANQLGSSAAAAVQATNYAYYNGTSMATPHVSAVAALVWSFHPECKAEEIRNALNMSAEDIGVAGRDDKTGNGLVQTKGALDYLASHACGV